MAIGQDIGMGTSYGGGITGLNTGVNLAATGLQTSNAPRPRMQGTPNLNQLYQTAMDAFRKTAPSGWQTESYFTPVTGNAEFAKYAPEGGILTDLTQDDRRKLSQGVHKNQWLADVMGGTSGATGITTLPAATNIVPTAEPTYPTQAEFLQQKQDEWRAENPEPAVMPNFQITGTDIPASEAAGYDVPLWTADGPSELTPEQMSATLKDPGLTSIPGTIPEQYMDFFNSQFYDPDAGALGVMTPVTLPSGETITFPDSAMANQFQQYLDSRVWQAANGGIVGLDYLTRRL